MENQYIGGELSKKRTWTVCRFKKGPWQKRGEDVFEGGLRSQCTLRHYDYWQRILTKKYPKQITVCVTNTVILLIIVILIET